MASQNQTVTPHPHSFSLRPLRPLPSPTTTISHLFQQSTPTYSPTDSTAHLPPTLTLPVFNQDKTHYTPTFILPLDSNYYKLNSDFEGQKFEEKVDQAKQELSNSSLQIPRPEFDFCQICRQTFPDYPAHVSSSAHLQLQNKAPGNRYLTQLCQLFAKKAKAIQKTEKTRPLPKEPVNTRKVKKKLPPHPSHSLQLTPDTHSHSQQ